MCAPLRPLPSLRSFLLLVSLVPVLVAGALAGCAPSGEPAADPSSGEGADVAVDVVGDEDAADRPAWALAIHGGAGVISKDMPEDRKQAYFDALEAALETGRESLDGGATALETVEAVVRQLEDDPKFNAGKGAVYTHEETHELDAAIMDGATLDCGSVAAITTVKNPITLARLVMERSPHVFLIGEGAEVFADETGVERVDPSYFDTERRLEQLRRRLEDSTEEEAAGAAEDTERSTVGAVALDRHGDLAAATSTGGLTDKRFGRVGDVPVIGAGTYANNATCAVSGTGKGEQFIRHTVAHSISAAMEHGGLSLREAAELVIHERLEPGDGGVIAVGADGSIALVFNSAGMFRGAADADGRFEVAIWER